MEEDFEAWAVARAAKLHRTAYLLCGDWHAAQDLVQEALARTAVAWTRIQRLDNPDAYVRRILINQTRQRWRLRRTHELPTGRSLDAGVDDGAAERAERDAVVAALRLLPARQRAVVVLRYFEQLSVEETAQALGCSDGTIKSQTSRALKTLRTALDEEMTPCSPKT